MKSNFAKRWISLFLVAASCLVLVSCGKTTADPAPSKVEEEGYTLYQLQPPKLGDTIARITTNYGEMVFRLFPDLVPKSVENFVTHAKKEYYDYTLFHRFVKNSILQGGDPTGEGTGGESIWGGHFDDEISTPLKLWNFRGALAYANDGANTNGSQFYIVTSKEVRKTDLEVMKDIYEEGDSLSRSWNEEVRRAYKEFGGLPDRDRNYTIFGQMIEGFETLKKIDEISVGGIKGDTPKENIVIKSVRIEVIDEEYFETAKPKK